MSDLVIRVENLSKQYRIFGKKANYRTFREALLESFSLPFRWMRGEQKSYNSFWALDNVSFDVKQGEAIGIIGRNGAGKSTLLKILSRITKPTKGRVELYGRVASLLEVGTGFHGELSGRDNIYLNGAILSMTRREIDRKFDEIVDFSGVEKFIDTPVKHYSSGMYVRLAFAVAAHLEPEILIVDEVLAVGDAEFQKKCLGKMGDVAKEGRTVLFVSHNLDAIKNLCHRTVLFKQGILVYDGSTPDTLSKYLGKPDSNSATVTWETNARPSLPGTELIETGILSSGKNVGTDLPSEEPISVYMIVRVRKAGTKVGTTVILRNSENQILFVSISNHEKKWHLKERPQGDYISTCEIPASLLAKGSYSLTIGLWEGFYESGVIKDDVIQFSVHETGLVKGDLPYEMNDGLIRPFLNWHSDYIGPYEEE